MITYSERLQHWLGMQQAELASKSLLRVHPKDRKRIQAALIKALKKESSGHFNETYTITSAQTRRERIIHVSGQTLFDDDGKALGISGTAQDVNIQKEMQLALENQVQIRTEDLASMNEQLTTTNQDLITKNAELTESTALLVRSNENLQKFAYVASHDLQEPLRKIQQFSDLLERKYVDLTGEQLDYLQRIRTAASRMSILIKDLLDFSA